MTALRIKTTAGIKCKACDRSLDGHDPELCGNCLQVVHELNKNLYQDDDDFIEKLEEE